MHPLKSDELLIKVIFLCFYNELKFHILSRDRKMFGLSPGIKISLSSKCGHSTYYSSLHKLITHTHKLITSLYNAQLKTNVITCIICNRCTPADRFTHL